MLVLLAMLAGCPEPEPEATDALYSAWAECSDGTWEVGVDADLAPWSWVDVHASADGFDLVTPTGSFDAPCDADIVVRLWAASGSGAAVTECASTDGASVPSGWPSCMPVQPM